MKEYFSLDGNTLNNFYYLDVIEDFEIFRGPPGNTGRIGQSGQQGFQGQQGIRGHKGDMGETGDKGQQGYRGKEGEEGERGITGKAGDKGARGLFGKKGDKGDFGPKGADGFIGEAGSEGEKGPTGYIGLQGDQGERGDTPEVKIVIEDSMGMDGMRMDGFPNREGIDNMKNISSIGNNYNDPLKEGAVAPVLKQDYKYPLEAQCPYNSYINGFAFEIPDIGDGNAKQMRYEDVRERVTNSNHMSAQLNPGMPYTYRVKCKTINNKGLN